MKTLAGLPPPGGAGRGVQFRDLRQMVCAAVKKEVSESTLENLCCNAAFMLEAGLERHKRAGAGEKYLYFRSASPAEAATRPLARQADAADLRRALPGLAALRPLSGDTSCGLKLKDLVSALQDALGMVVPSPRVSDFLALERNARRANVERVKPQGSNTYVYFRAFKAANIAQQPPPKQPLERPPEQPLERVSEQPLRHPPELQEQAPKQIFDSLAPPPRARSLFGAKAAGQPGSAFEEFSAEELRWQHVQFLASAGAQDMEVDMEADEEAKVFEVFKAKGQLSQQGAEAGAEAEAQTAEAPPPLAGISTLEVTEPPQTNSDEERLQLAALQCASAVRDRARHRACACALCISEAVLLVCAARAKADDMAAAASRFLTEAERADAGGFLNLPEAADLRDALLRASRKRAAPDRN
jgi:hypothetical protein